MVAAASDTPAPSVLRSIRLDRLDLLVLGGIALATLLRLVVAGAANLSEDEAYYWLWSLNLQPGYYDHPPMVAYWIRFGTDLFGRGEIGVRLSAALGTAGASWLLYLTAIALFEDRRVAVNTVVWFNACLLVSVGGVIITPDTPLLFFWIAALFSLAKIRQTADGRWWLVYGISAGFALVSKYPAALLAPVTLLWLVSWPQGRHWLLRIEPYIAAFIALVLFTPVLWWNQRHDWISFTKQLRHAGETAPTGTLENLGHFLGAQFWVITPVMFLLLLAAMFIAARRGFSKRDPGLLLAAATSAPIFLFFLEHSLGHRIEANWAAPLLPGGILAATALWSGTERRVLFHLAPASALAFTLIAYAQAAFAPAALSPRIDPTARLAGWPQLAAGIAQACRDVHCDFIFTTNYQLTAELIYYLPESIPVYQAFQQIRYADPLKLDDGARAGKTGLYVADARKNQSDAVAPHFAAFEALPDAHRMRNAGAIGDYVIAAGRSYLGGLAP